MAIIEPSPTASTPRLTAIHHVGLTVRDVEASAAWYQRVLGLGRVFEEPHLGSEAGGYAVVLATPDRRVDIGLDHHPANRGEEFDPTRTGLDHVSFHVETVTELAAWAAHLDREGIANSGVYEMESMPVSLLTFNDPDGIQLEFITFHQS